MTTAPSPSTPLPHAWTVPAFRSFYAIRAVALFGHALTLVAMPLMAYRITASALLTAIVAGANSSPYLIFGLLAGALADRVNRRRVMVWCGVASSLLLGSVPVAHLTGHLTYTHVLLAQAGVASLFVFSDAASFGVLVVITGRRALPSATSTLMILSSAMSLLGPALAGALLITMSPATLIIVDTVGFMLVAACLARLRWAGPDRPARTQPSTVRHDIVEGLRYIWHTHVLRWLTLFGFGASFTLGGVTGLLVVLGVEQFGLAADSPRLGWLYAASAAGTLAGTLILPLLQRRFRVGRITSVGLAGAVLVLLVLSTTHDLGAGMVLVALYGVPTMALILNAMVVRAYITPDAFQARVNTTGRMIAGGGGPFGTLVAGLVAQYAGTEWAVRAIAAGMVLSLVGVITVGVHRYPHLHRMRAA